MAEIRMSLGVVMNVYSTLSRLRQEFTTTDSGDRDFNSSFGTYKL